MSTQLSLFDNTPFRYERNRRIYVRLDASQPIILNEKSCVLHHVLGTGCTGEKIEMNFIFFPDLNKHVRTLSSGLLHKQLVSKDFYTESIKYLFGYSKRVCQNFSRGERGKNKLKKKWKQRYTDHLQDWFWFDKPRKTSSIEIKTTIATNIPDLSGTVCYAYVPETDSFHEHCLDFGNRSSMQIGFIGYGKKTILKKLIKRCVLRAQHGDLFE